MLCCFRCIFHFLEQTKLSLWNKHECIVLTMSQCCERRVQGGSFDRGIANVHAYTSTCTSRQKTECSQSIRTPVWLRHPGLWWPVSNNSGRQLFVGVFIWDSVYPLDWERQLTCHQYVYAWPWSYPYIRYPYIPLPRREASSPQAAIGSAWSELADAGHPTPSGIDIQPHVEAGHALRVEQPKRSYCLTPIALHSPTWDILHFRLICSNSTNLSRRSGNLLCLLCSISPTSISAVIAVTPAKGTICLPQSPIKQMPSNVRKANVRMGLVGQRLQPSERISQTCMHCRLCSKLLLSVWPWDRTSQEGSPCIERRIEIGICAKYLELAVSNHCE